MDYTPGMHTIVEMPEFIRRAEALISEDEKKEIINYLAAHTETGVVMKGTGGIRKLRWAIGNRCIKCLIILTVLNKGLKRL